MAVVRCPCGATREVPDDRLGAFVTCPVCNDLFMAGKPPARPPAPKKRIGEIAVELGLVSREHLDLCVEYQEALRSTAGPETKRLGEILVDKGLLKPKQVEALLAEQSGEAPKRRPAPARLVSRAEQIRESLEREARASARPFRRGFRWVGYLGVALLAVGGAVAAVVLWPEPAARRTLDAYLRGCSEQAATRADYLAARDLGITVREFRIESLAPSSRHDYTPDLGVFTRLHEHGTWAEFVAAPELSAEKRQALEVVLPCLPRTLTPRQASSLAITVQPATVSLIYRPNGEHLFSRGRCRFTLIRIDSPRWSLGWRVAACEPLEPSRAEP